MRYRRPLRTLLGALARTELLSGFVEAIAVHRADALGST
jgi:hypothetical protein